jgi:hypothetical protein
MVVFPQLFPALALRFAPALHARVLGIVARDVHLDAANLEIAVAGDRRDAAIALDLRKQRGAGKTSASADAPPIPAAIQAFRLNFGICIARGTAKGTPVEWPPDPVVRDLFAGAFAERQVEIQAGKR